MITRLTHLLWSRSTRAALLPIALTLALLPSAAPALAQAQRTPLAGVENEVFDFSTVSRLKGAGPWLLAQDLTLSGTFNYGALAGTVMEVDNVRNDPTGDGQVWGTVTYTATSGLVCSGNFSGKITGFFLTAQIVAPCSDGSLLQGTLQTVSNDFVVVTSTFQGELLSP
jgi:hypothetical protein